MSTGAFASIHFKSSPNKTATNNRVSVIPLHHSRGFAIMVDKAIPGSSEVIIYDSDGNGLFKDKLPNGIRSEKKYLTRELDNGQYTVEIYSKDLDVKTKFYIYNNGARRVEDIQ